MYTVGGGGIVACDIFMIGGLAVCDSLRQRGGGVKFVTYFLNGLYTALHFVLCLVHVFIYVCFTLQNITLK